MSNYGYNPLGTKPLNTRFSELRQCSGPVAALKVAMTRLEWLKQADSADMRFGRVRHRMFEEETRKTGQTPIITSYYAKAEPEVVINAPVWGCGRIWGRVDALVETDEGQLILDYKTTKEGGSKNFDKRQLLTYIIVARASGIDVKGAIFLFETWSDDKKRILNHSVERVNFTEQDLIDTKRWLRKRAKLLRGAINQVKVATYSL